MKIGEKYFSVDPNIVKIRETEQISFQQYTVFQRNIDQYSNDKRNKNRITPCHSSNFSVLPVIDKDILMVLWKLRKQIHEKCIL